MKLALKLIYYVTHIHLFISYKFVVINCIHTNEFENEEYEIS